MSATVLPPVEIQPPVKIREETPFQRLCIDFAQSKLALLGLVVLVLIVLVAIIAPWIAPHNPYDLALFEILDGRQPPGS